MAELWEMMMEMYGQKAGVGWFGGSMVQSKKRVWTFPLFV